jgi:hypothetical protein
MLARTTHAMRSRLLFIGFPSMRAGALPSRLCYLFGQNTAGDILGVSWLTKH